MWPPAVRIPPDPRLYPSESNRLFALARSNCAALTAGFAHEPVEAGMIDQHLRRAGGVGAQGQSIAAAALRVERIEIEAAFEQRRQIGRVVALDRREVVFIRAGMGARYRAGDKGMRPTSALPSRNTCSSLTVSVSPAEFPSRHNDAKRPSSSRCA